jgi:hypothetical protein
MQIQSPNLDGVIPSEAAFQAERRISVSSGPKRQPKTSAQFSQAKATDNYSP